MKAVLIGLGEIGKGLYEVFSKCHDIIIHDPMLGHLAEEDRYDVMMIAIPYDDLFITMVKRYTLKFAPKCVIVFSSVPVGTCRHLGAIHSPIEGRHDNMAESIRLCPRWMGGESKDNIALNFFLQANLSVEMYSNPEMTEFLKLRSTMLYGISIEMARYSKEVADELGMDYRSIKRYDQDYNTLVCLTGGSHLQRPILDPPEGKIGGHCVLPNAKLLRQTHDHPYIQTLLVLNEEGIGKIKRDGPGSLTCDRAGPVTEEDCKTCYGTGSCGYGKEK